MRLAPRTLLLCPLTLSPREHDSSSVLLEVFRKFRMLQLAMVHDECNMNSSSVNLGCPTTSAFGFTFITSQACKRLSLSTAALAGFLNASLTVMGFLYLAVTELIAFRQRNPYVYDVFSLMF